MELSHRRVDEVLIIYLSGDLIGENEELKILNVANDAIDHNIFAIAIDIEKVRYINSSGLSILIKLLTKVKNKGGEVILIKPSERITKLLEITKLNVVFTSSSTLEEALQQLKS